MTGVVATALRGKIMNMMMAGLLLQAAAPAPAPIAAVPTDPGVVCILSAVAPADRAAVAADAIAGTHDDAAGTRFDEAIARCAQQGHWQESQGVAYSGVAIGVLMRDTTAAALTAAGIPPARVEAWLDHQGPNGRTAYPSDADGNRLVTDLAAGGIAMDLLQREGPQIGQYVGALIVLARAARGMPITD
jgi:hypothetical protein